MNENSDLKPADEQPIDKRLLNLRPAWGKDNPPPKSPGASGPHLTTILKKMMGCECPSKAAEMIRREYPGIDEKKLTRAHMYMAKLDNAAARGEEWALRLAFERTEGKPKDQNYTEDNRGLILSAIDEALK